MCVCVSVFCLLSFVFCLLSLLGQRRTHYWGLCACTFAFASCVNGVGLTEQEEAELVDRAKRQFKANGLPMFVAKVKRAKRTFALLQTHRHKHIHTYTNTRAHAHTHRHSHTPHHPTNTRKHAQTHTHTHSLSLSLFLLVEKVHFVLRR